MSSNVKCFHCGFIDWAGVPRCRRCGNLYYGSGGGRARDVRPHNGLGHPEPLFTGSVRFLVWAIGIGFSSLLLARMHDEKLGLVVAGAMAVTGILSVVAGVLMQVAGTFRVGFMWGVGTLLVPVVHLIFAVKYWDVVRRPLAIQILGTILFLVGFLA